MKIFNLEYWKEFFIFLNSSGGNVYYGSLAFVFFLGASCGSFMNAVAGRCVEDKEWWGKARSECPFCKKRLCWYELVPVFSWIFLRGKCFSCKKSISFKYLGMEILCGLLSTIGFLYWKFSPEYVFWLVGFTFIGISVMTDLKNGYVYDSVTITGTILAFVFRLIFSFAYSDRSIVLDGIYGSGIGFALIALIIVLSKNKMGWGDAVVLIGIGAAFGWKSTLLALYASFMFGGVFSIVMIMIKKMSRKDPVPFVPFLAIGTMLALFFEDLIFFMAVMGNVHIFN